MRNLIQFPTCSFSTRQLIRGPRARGHPTEQTAEGQINGYLCHRLSPFLLTSPLKQTSSHLPGRPFSMPLSSHCTHLCVITSLKKKRRRRMQVNATCLSLFFLPHGLAFYWFPCPRSHVQTRFLQSQSCLFVFISHLATQSWGKSPKQSLPTCISTMLWWFFPATQTSLSFHPVAIITKVEKGPSPCLLPLGKIRPVEKFVPARCFSLFYLSS